MLFLFCMLVLLLCMHVRGTTCPLQDYVCSDSRSARALFQAFSCALSFLLRRIFFSHFTCLFPHNLACSSFFASIVFSNHVHGCSACQPFYGRPSMRGCSLQQRHTLREYSPASKTNKGFFVIAVKVLRHKRNRQASATDTRRIDIQSCLVK